MKNIAAPPWKNPGYVPETDQLFLSVLCAAAGAAAGGRGGGLYLALLPSYANAAGHFVVCMQFCRRGAACKNFPRAHPQARIGFLQPWCRPRWGREGTQDDHPAGLAPLHQYCGRHGAVQACTHLRHHTLQATCKVYRTTAQGGGCRGQEEEPTKNDIV